jgi:hypothetical protein
MHIDGACHCGSVSFTAQIDPAQVVACHCSDCQVLSSAPFRTGAVAPFSTLKVQGATKTYIKVAQSGNKRAQVFCPECGTPLWASAPENPFLVVIRLGCVAQRAQLRPVVQIWNHSAMPWLPDLNYIAITPEGTGFVPTAPPPSAS